MCILKTEDRFLCVFRLHSEEGTHFPLVKPVDELPLLSLLVCISKDMHKSSLCPTSFVLSLLFLSKMSSDTCNKLVYFLY